MRLRSHVSKASVRSRYTTYLKQAQRVSTTLGLFLVGRPCDCRNTLQTMDNRSLGLNFRQPAEKKESKKEYSENHLTSLRKVDTLPSSEFSISVKFLSFPLPFPLLFNPISLLTGILYLKLQLPSSLKLTQSGRVCCKYHVLLWLHNWVLFSQTSAKGSVRLAAGAWLWNKLINYLSGDHASHQQP